MKRLFTSCFGLGFLPIAPGTWGSLPPLLVFYFLSYFDADRFIIAATMAIFAILGSFVCVKFSSAAIEKTGSNDPREVVADEVAGQAVTFLGISLAANFPVCVTAAAGFLLFRLFDVFKPWPVRQFERFPKGWGILLDDIAAGIYSAIILVILLRTGLLGYISRIL
jgi:phosphatidylglycerophosphatase A